MSQQCINRVLLFKYCAKIYLYFASNAEAHFAWTNLHETEIKDRFCCCIIHYNSYTSEGENQTDVADEIISWSGSDTASDSEMNEPVITNLKEKGTLGDGDCENQSDIEDEHDEVICLSDSDTASEGEMKGSVISRNRKMLDHISRDELFKPYPCGPRVKNMSSTTSSPYLKLMQPRRLQVLWMW